MSKTPDNETRARILDAAEHLFHTRGYDAVKLREIAAAVGIHHASLYYYVPKGKEQLYIEVMERSIARHEQGLKQSIAGAQSDIRAQMRAAAQWLALQPPMDIARMAESDMRALEAAEAMRLMQSAYDALRMPLVTALAVAQEAGTIQERDLDTAAMALVSLVQSVHGIPGLKSERARVRLAEKLVDMLLDGLLTRG